MFFFVRAKRGPSSGFDNVIVPDRRTIFRLFLNRAHRLNDHKFVSEYHLFRTLKVPPFEDLYFSSLENLYLFWIFR